MNLYDYARLSDTEKERLLTNKAVFIEHYTEVDLTICLYMLFDFFVETKVKDGDIIENLPFKRGFKPASHSFKGDPSLFLAA